MHLKMVYITQEHIQCAQERNINIIIARVNTSLCKNILIYLTITKIVTTYIQIIYVNTRGGGGIGRYIHVRCVMWKNCRNKRTIRSVR